MTIKNTKLIWIVLLIEVALVQFISQFTNWVEEVYSSNLFLKIAHFERLVFGKLPFSMGDLVYVILILYIIGLLWKGLKNQDNSVNQGFYQLLKLIGVVYFLFYFLWGLNYYRKPLFEKMNIDNTYSNADLLLFTEKLIDETNQIQFNIARSKTFKITNPYSENQLISISIIGYDNLNKKNACFEYKTPSIKPSLFSFLLSYMGFSGYLNPFTNEAQFNSKVPKYGFPMTICHEMAHQIGFASESECHFIGYLACLNSKNLYHRYAANILALKYCFQALAINNNDFAKQEYQKLNLGIIENLKEDKAFYKQYHTFIDSGFEMFYDRFLKLNQQKDGMEGYSKFLNLLINYQKQVSEN